MDKEDPSHFKCMVVIDSSSKLLILERSSIGGTRINTPEFERCSLMNDSCSKISSLLTEEVEVFTLQSMIIKEQLDGKGYSYPNAY